MLHEVVTRHRDSILAAARAKVSRRSSPPVTPKELDQGLPLLLTQLADILRGDTSSPGSMEAIGRLEIQHGHELRALHLDLPQVVHGYGDLCEAITEVAVRENPSIAFEELQTLNRCLETAVAEATAWHGRVSAMPPETRVENAAR